MRPIFLITIMICATLPFSSLASDNESAKSAKKAWSSFACSIYASYANKKEDSEALFKVGYREIHKFLKAVEAKEISEDEYKSNVPVGISFVLRGPTKDFIAGRIYETVSTDASDEIVKEDASGLPINDPNKWNMDKAHQFLIANNKYSKSNCDFLK